MAKVALLKLQYLGHVLSGSTWQLALNAVGRQYGGQVISRKHVAACIECCWKAVWRTSDIEEARGSLH